MLAQHILKRARLDGAHLDGTWIWGLMLCLFLASCSMPFTSTAPPTPTNTPSAVAVAKPFHGTVKTLDGALTITLDITPNHSGPNVFTISVLDNQTTRPANVMAVTLYTTMQDMPMGTDSITLQATTNGQFRTTSNNLNMGGHWAIAIAVQTVDHIIHKAGLRVVTSL